jgi:hypothetical protein
VLSWPEIEELMAGSDNLLQQFESLRAEVFSSTGHVSQLINNLETRLNTALASEVTRINNLLTQVAQLTSQVSELRTDLTSTNTALSTLSNRLTANDVDNNALWGAIGGRTGFRLMLPEPRWAGQVPGRSNILFLQFDTILNAVFWAPPPVINGGWVGTYRFGFMNPGVLDLGELVDRTP